MSSMLEALREAGENFIDSKGGDLLDDLLDDTEAKAAELLTGDLAGLRVPALAAVEVLREAKVKEAAKVLSKFGLATVIGFFDSGDPEGIQAARLVYIRTRATMEERIEFQEQAGDAAMLLHDKREQAWDDLANAFKRIGKVALKALGMLVLGLLGL